MVALSSDASSVVVVSKAAPSAVSGVWSLACSATVIS